MSSEKKTKSKGRPKGRPKKKAKVPEPFIESNFIKFFATLMIFKTLLLKCGYSNYWDKWSLHELSDTYLFLRVNGYAI